LAIAHAFVFSEKPRGSEVSASLVKEPQFFGTHTAVCGRKKGQNSLKSKCFGLLWMLLDEILVEAAGIEPASASPTQTVLHT
jgi:hypothetical protein